MPEPTAKTWFHIDSTLWHLFPWISWFLDPSCPPPSASKDWHTVAYSASIKDLSKAFCYRTLINIIQVPGIYLLYMQHTFDIFLKPNNQPTSMSSSTSKPSLPVHTAALLQSAYGNTRNFISSPCCNLATGLHEKIDTPCSGVWGVKAVELGWKLTRATAGRVVHIFRWRKSMESPHNFNESLPKYTAGVLGHFHSGEI